MILTLLAITLEVPLISASTYTLTVESYVQKPWEGTATSFSIEIYVSPYGSLGGTAYTTLTDISGLNEGVQYSIKVPLSASYGSSDVVIFDHWEGDTDIISGPMADLEKIDTNGDGVLDEPYVVFTLLNPPGAGDKLVKAMYELQWGPLGEHLSFHVIWGPTGQRIALLNGEVDVLTDLTRPIDIDSLSAGLDGIEGTEDDNIISAITGFHMCYFGFNMRKAPFGPADGSNPGLALRQATAYLLFKDNLIATLFRYVAGRLDTFVPPAMAAWFNPDVTIYDYDSSQANSTLIAAGYTFDAAEDRWRDPSGALLPDINIMCPLFEVAPTSYSIASTLVEEMKNLKIWATLAPTDFWTLNVDVFQYHNFDMYFSGWKTLSRFPDYLYDFFHSSNDIEWGDNAPGIRNAELDEKLEVIKFSLDHAAKEEATMDAQVMLADLLPYIPVYSRNYFNAHRPDFHGLVLSPGYGVSNFWAFMEIHGPRESPIVKPPDYPIQGNRTIWTIGDKPESFNPATAGTTFAWDILGNVYNVYGPDSLLLMNPYTHKDIPWLAEDWIVEGPINTIAPNGGKIVNGMKITFDLTDTTVYWHDGEEFDANDVVFAWEFVRDDALPNFLSFWEYLIDTDAPDTKTAVAYLNTTSQWLLYEAANIAVIFPPQVWGPLKGTGAMNIMNFNPEQHLRSELGSYPAEAAYPWLTQVIGVGPWMFKSTTTDRIDTDLVAFDVRTHASGSNIPTLHFFKTTGEITELFVEMFYMIGDVSINGVVDIMDLARLGMKFLDTGLPGWVQEDVVKDGVINVLDLATSGKNYGKLREY